MSEKEMQEKQYPVQQKAAFAGTTLIGMGLFDLLAHLGPTGLFVGGLASYVAWKHGPEIAEQVRGLFPSSEYQEEDGQLYEPQKIEPKGRSFWDRALGIYPDRDDDEGDDASFDLDGDEDLMRPRSSRDFFLFSEVIKTFDPTLAKIFLGRTPTGLDLYCTARDLCHVAIAGNTGAGKSSIMRMLMLQLCRSEVRVLLLNPHYTRYDIEAIGPDGRSCPEDWTPFEPYLVHDPMECRSYQVIEHYLKNVAKDLIPKRLERRAHSQPVGKPYFIVLDELPSIVREIKDSPDCLRVILEEGRKVGVFVISAAHDFLVKTISPKSGGGSIRDCYRTSYYVGGDPKTASVLLNMAANLIEETELGKGVVMLRSVPTKKAVQALVPYVDNASLYRLLGPSTYKWPAQVSDRTPELDAPAISQISTSGNGEMDGNGSGNDVEMAHEADAEKIIDMPFPISRGRAEMGNTRSKPDVSEDKLEMISRMKERNFQDNEIAGLVGLSGRKYGVYRECLVYLGYKVAKEG